MKKNTLLAAVFCLLAAVPLTSTTLAAPVKKILMVTTTTGYRHSSIPNLEKVITRLGQESREFTVELVQQPPGKPTNPKKDATPEENEAFKAAEAKWEETLKSTLQKLSPDSLRSYDGVIFASTTGMLPIPDMQGFLDWIKAGHAFIGIHAASDTFLKAPEFIAMLGGAFDHHGPQVGVVCINEDLQHPSTAHLGKNWTIAREEIYQFKDYDSAKVHELLELDKNPETGAPGHFPVSWCRKFGEGRVFYTSIGHREDIIDDDPALEGRINPIQVSKAYQKHILGGIEWALGLKEGVPVGAK